MTEDEARTLIDELKRLPGIGSKSAQRIAFHILRGSRDDAADAIVERAVDGHHGVAQVCRCAGIVVVVPCVEIAPEPVPAAVRLAEGTGEQIPLPAAKHVQQQGGLVAHAVEQVLE